jgi:hypothetical protein
MGSFFSFIITWVVRPIVGVVIGQAALKALHALGYYPEVWLAEKVVSVATPTPDELELASWLFAALVGVLLLAIHETYRRRAQRGASQPFGLGERIISAFFVRESREAPIWKAIEHVRQVIGDDDDTRCWPKTCTEIRQAALNEELAIRGRHQLKTAGQTLFSDVHDDVPRDYWRISKINALATSDAHSSDRHTDPESTWAWGPAGIDEQKRYADLRVSMKEVQKRWSSKKLPLSNSA